MNALLCPSAGDRGSPSDRKPFAAKLKIAAQITAAESLPVDSVSASCCVDELLEGKRERTFQRIGLQHGQVAPEKYGGECESGAWIKYLRLAANIHYQNLTVEVAKGRRIRVRVVADVQPGEEVQLWFSPQVLLAMQIPFLSPANIKGQNVYRCHNCDQVYEDPNPLKIHLARHCDSLPLDVIWQRLRNFLPQPPSPPPAAQHRISAFHPVGHGHRLSPPQQLPASHTSSAPPSSPGAHSGFGYADPEHLANSHLETIVSNMGTSKQGHLCIYCGKLYSRKYGLKIHIRTHTGFKPLKCKFCHRPFGDPSNLNKHLRLHLQNQSPHAAHGTQSNFYKCHLCAKIMIRKRDLQRHIEMRHFHGQRHHAPEEDQEEQQSRSGFSGDSASVVSSNSACSSSNEEEEDEDIDVDVDMADD